MPERTPRPDDAIESRMRTVRDLHAWGIFLIRERLRRENPDLSKAELGRKLEDYLIHANAPHDPNVFAVRRRGRVTR
jgi:hypothetical protein